MNLLKLASIANLDNDRRIGEKRFVQNQSQANNLIHQNHKNNYNFNEAQQVVGISMMHIPEGHKVKFNESGVNSRIQGKILEEQLKLRCLESEYDLERSRIEDEHNAKTFRIRYPYGKENVKITEDVLQKYRANNYDQTNILKKFEQQAKVRKKLQKSQRRIQLQSSYKLSPVNMTVQHTERHQRKKITSILQRQKNKLYRAKEEYMKQVQKSREKSRKISKQNRYVKQQENKRIENIETMLKDVRDRLDENFSMITDRETAKHRQHHIIREVDLSRDRLNQLTNLDHEEEFCRKKLPVIVYKENKNSSYNFVNMRVPTDLESIERTERLDKPREFDEVLKIYQLNKVRLDRLCERVSVKGNKSSIVY